MKWTEQFGGFFGRREHTRGAPGAPSGRADEALHWHHQNMVDSLVASGSIRSGAVEAAFRALPRHCFVEQYYNRTGALIRVTPDAMTRSQGEDLYEDRAITTHLIDGQAVSSTSQPSLMAMMLEAMELRPGHKVLEIGAGTGWNAALMAHMVAPEGKVVSVEILPDAADAARRHLERMGIANAEVITRDGGMGHAAAAPYDRIVATASSTAIPGPWREQLVEGGLLLVNLLTRGSGQWSELTLVRRHGGALEGEVLCPTSFVPLRGTYEDCDDDPADPIAADPPPGDITDAPWKHWRIPAHQRDHLLSDVVYFLWMEGFEISDLEGKYELRLAGHEGFALLTTETIELCGGNAVLDPILRATRRWLDLGAPRRRDWRITFLHEGEQDAGTPAGRYCRILRQGDLLIRYHLDEAGLKDGR